MQGLVIIAEVFTIFQSVAIATKAGGITEVYIKGPKAEKEQYGIRQKKWCFHSSWVIVDVGAYNGNYYKG